MNTNATIEKMQKMRLNGIRPTNTTIAVKKDYNNPLSIR